MDLGWRAFCLVLAGVGAGPERPAVTVRLARPDEQAGRAIALFVGSRAPSPAAALAAWKNATGRGLGRKPLEAAIAAFNPGMARELRVLDGAEFRAWAGPDGAFRWCAAAPADDGTLADAVTALSLTEGGRDEPIGAVAVDRVGGWRLARTARGLVAAGSREDLEAALGLAPAGPAGIGSGWLVRLDPAGLDGSNEINPRRLAAGLRAAGCAGLEATAALEGSALTVELRGRFEPAPPAGPPIALDWLGWAPAGRSLAAVALAIGPRGWDVAFPVLDAIEKADPARKAAAPLRARLNLLAWAAGVRPEVELWPRLKGISAGVLADDAGRIDGGWLALHATDADAADRLKERVLPRFASAAGLLPLAAERRGSTVLVAWGDGVLAACLAASEHPERSACRGLRAELTKAPQRFGALWAGKLAGLTPDLRAALAEAPPVLWRGEDDGAASRDVVRWEGLDATVRRFLDRLPLEPPAVGAAPGG